MEDWDKAFLSEPFDTNPLNYQNNQLHLSHYKRFGTDCDDWKTTTEESLQKTLTSKFGLKINPIKETYNVHSFILDVCNPSFSLQAALMRTDDETTMKSSYQTNFKQQPATEVDQDVLWFSNRFLSKSVCGKFIDDDYLERLKRLQKHKGNRHASFNPNTHLYSDEIVDHRGSNVIWLLFN